LSPPSDAVCFVRGTGDPFSNRCSESVSVTQGKDGSTPIGKLDVRSLDVTWAFFEGKGRAWVGARSAGVTMTGFADTKDRSFRLTSETAAIPGHIWFREGARVVVKDAKTNTIDVAVVADTFGGQSLLAETTCDNLAFDPQSQADIRASRKTTTRAASGHTAAPMRSVLPLRLAPRGLVVMTLTYDKDPLPITVNVTERDGAFSRIVFDTEEAHFDVWVSSTELDTAHGRGVGHGSSACGGRTVDPDPASLFDVLADTPVVVARKPALGGGVDGVTIARGGLVSTLRRQGGFAEITTPFGAITAPTGLSFWIPETALRHHEGPKPR
jgi:hypothetical protein